MAGDDHVRRNKRLWGALVLSAVTVFTLGYYGYGYMLAHDQGGDKWNRRDAVYGSLGLFVFNDPKWGDLDWRLDLARFLAPLVTGGFGLATAYALFREEAWLLRTRFSPGHIVVCGLGDLGFAFVQQLRREGRRVVAIEKDGTNPNITECHRLAVPVIRGNAQHLAVLRRSGLPHAASLISSCKGDSLNIDILLNAQLIAEGRRRAALDRHGPLFCLAEVEDVENCNMLRTYLAQGNATWVADLFSTYDIAAARLLIDHPVVQPGDGAPHIVIASLGVLGERTLVWAAYRWLAGRTVKEPLRVTLMDKDAKTRLDDLVRRTEFRRLFDGNVVDVTCVSSEAELERHCREGPFGMPQRIYVTDLNDDEGVRTTMRAWESISAPIVVAQRRKAGVARLLEGLESADVEVFPMFTRTLTSNVLVEFDPDRMARAIHDIWRERRVAAGEDAPEYDADDAAEMRESSLAQALDIPAKLRAIDCTTRRLSTGRRTDVAFTPVEIEQLARQEHERWVRERRQQGWKVGPRDHAAKTTPYLVPFEELPADVADYDRMFVRSIPDVLTRAGYQLVRN